MAVFIALLEAMRPRQWTKNVFVFAGIVFGQRLFALPTLMESWLSAPSSSATSTGGADWDGIVYRFLRMLEEQVIWPKRFRNLAEARGAYPADLASVGATRR